MPVFVLDCFHFPLRNELYDLLKQQEHLNLIFCDNFHKLFEQTIAFLTLN